jgi:hypothetical protein
VCVCVCVPCGTIECFCEINAAREPADSVSWDDIRNRLSERRRRMNLELARLRAMLDGAEERGTWKGHDEDYAWVNLASKNDDDEEDDDDDDEEDDKVSVHTCAVCACVCRWDTWAGFDSEHLFGCVFHSQGPSVSVSSQRVVPSTAGKTDEDETAVTTTGKVTGKTATKTAAKSAAKSAGKAAAKSAGKATTKEAVRAKAVDILSTLVLHKVSYDGSADQAVSIAQRRVEKAKVKVAAAKLLTKQIASALADAKKDNELVDNSKEIKKLSVELVVAKKSFNKTQAKLAKARARVAKAVATKKALNKVCCTSGVLRMFSCFLVCFSA